MAGKSTARKLNGSLTAEAIFIQKCWDEHQMRHAEQQITFLVFTRRCTERWKTMTESEQKSFHDMAEKEKIGYEQEMGTSPGVKNPQGKKRKLKDPQAPKRFLSPFFWFSNDVRPKLKERGVEFTGGEMAKELGRMWGELGPDARKKYEELSKRDKARYETEMVAYENRMKAKCAPLPIEMTKMTHIEDEDHAYINNRLEHSGKEKDSIPNVVMS